MIAASLELASPAPLAPLIATALAVAGFFALQAPALGSRNGASAVRAGIVGSAISVALIALSLSAPPAFLPAVNSGAASVAASFAAAATLAAAVALAGAGVHASSRAFGVMLATVRRPFPTPASVRLARMRGAQVALVVGCAFLDSKGVVDSRTALVLGMALSLAVTTPMIGLAAIERVGPLSASIAALVALAVGVMRAIALARPPGAADAFEAALLAAAAAFVAGSVASLVAPRRASSPTLGGFDPFAADSGSAEKETARFVVDPPVASGENAPALRRIVAIPGRDHAAGALDNRREGDDVVRL